MARILLNLLMVVAVLPLSVHGEEPSEGKPSMNVQVAAAITEALARGKTQPDEQRLATRIVLPEDINIDHNEKPQFSTDGFNVYPNAIDDIFGCYVQHGMIIKNYVSPDVGRYAPPDIVDCERRRQHAIPECPRT